MSDQPTQTLPPDQRLREIIAEYRAARAAGQPVDPQELLARHPELADPLRAFLACEQANGPAAAEQTVSFGPPPSPPVSPAAATTLAPPGTAATPSAPEGRQFGDYELLQVIARGGMGIVYKARHKNLHRIVALKMILAGQLASPEQVRRFHVEAEQGGSLDHPNIVPIYQVGEVQGQHYFTMKLIEGGRLSEHVPRLQQDPRAAARLMATVARAVHYAHQRGVLHRDLKPGNVLLDAQGQPHVTDFGLAKHLEGKGGDTQSGAIVGTPSYMAPEQAAGRKHLTTAADVYSLGAILYELLTGRPPFQADSAFDVVLQVLEREPARPSSINLRVNRDLETIALACLAKEPHRRYSSAEALAQDLERFLAGEPIRARPVGFVERTLKWVRRRPAAAALLAVSVLAVVGFALSGWRYNVRLQAALRQTDRARQLAEGNAAEAQRARQAAEANAEEARRERQVADVNAAEARRQSELAKANFRKRLDVVDDFLIRVDGRLANMKEMDMVRMEFLQEFLNLSRGLLEEQRNDPAVRRQVGLVYRRIGDVWRDGRRYKDGEEAYGKALELQDRLATDFASQPDYQNDLALTHAQLALLLEDRQRYADAQTAYRNAIDLQDRLAAIDSPGRPDYRERGARYRYNLATVFEQARQPPKAEELYREALDRQERLVADHAERPTSQSDLATTAASLGLLVSDTRPAEARRLLERALAARRRALQLAPNVREYNRNLRDGYADLADFLKERGLHAELVRMAADLRRDFPEKVGETYDAACYVANAILVVEASPHLSEPERQRLAGSYAEQAIALLHDAVKEGYTNRRHMDEDTDLDPLRARLDYRELVADLDKRFPAPPPTPARQYEGLLRAYQAAQSQYQYSAKRARTVAAKKQVQTKKPRFEEFAPKFLQLAEKHRDSPTAVEALCWVLEHSAPAAEEKAEPAAKQLREQALALLERDHFQKDELANVCQRFVDKPIPDVDKLLRAALEKHAQRDVRGLAGYALALSLAKQADAVRQSNPSKAVELNQKTEQELERVIREYASVPSGKTTLGEAAKDKLHELRCLTVGRPALEIEGEDFDGKKFKLSDYRGKVVVLDFWANWCGYCRQMYPHERALVQRLKDKPFALLGVNSDADKDEVMREIKKQQLDWRSWWDGGRTGRRIGKQWQIHSWPKVFVLDHKSVIRYRYDGYVRGAELDNAVDKLLEEREAETSGEKR